MFKHVDLYDFVSLNFSPNPVRKILEVDNSFTVVHNLFKLFCNKI